MLDSQPKPQGGHRKSGRYQQSAAPLCTGFLSRRIPLKLTHAHSAWLPYCSMSPARVASIRTCETCQFAQRLSLTPISLWESRARACARLPTPFLVARRKEGTLGRKPTADQPDCRGFRTAQLSSAALGGHRRSREWFLWACAREIEMRTAS